MDQLAHTEADIRSTCVSAAIHAAHGVCEDVHRTARQVIVMGKLSGRAEGSRAVDAMSHLPVAVLEVKDNAFGAGAGIPQIVAVDEASRHASPGRSEHTNTSPPSRLDVVLPRANSNRDAQ